MKDDNEIKEFWDKADTFINLANEIAQVSGDGKTSASFLYAVARYNVFVSSSKTKDKEELIALKDSFTEYMLDQYKKIWRKASMIILKTMSRTFQNKTHNKSFVWVAPLRYAAPQLERYKPKAHE